MAGKNTAVFGIYKYRAQAEDAVERMLGLGFRKEDISILLPDNPGSKDLAHEKHTKAPEGTAAGALTGGAVGGTLGVLAGIGALAIPGIGPLIAAGPIVAALAGVGAGGTLGGLIGALVGAGIPEYEAKRYEGRVRGGDILLSVHCDNSEWVKLAKDTLHQTGAEDISSAGESRADYAESDRPFARTSREERVERRMAAGSVRPLADYPDEEFRRDFDTRYVGRGYSYEQYEPAYRFGNNCATEERYRGRDWSEVEPEMRTEWESAGFGRWDDYVDAIRFGWNKGRRYH